MKYKNIFKPNGEVGICKICNEEHILTDDHVPPKGCGNCGLISVNPEYGEVFKEGKFHKKFQNGVKFKTICQRCNNQVGDDYDKYLIEFTNSASRIIKSKIVLPEIIDLKINVIGVIKSLYAHYLASSFFHDTLYDELCRKYIKALTQNPDIEINCAFYPFTDTVIVKDFTKMAILPNGVVPGLYMSVIKFFPLAFIFCETKNTFGWTNLNSLLKETNPDGTAIIKMALPESQWV